ncbi:MAG: response regulator [Halocynthiibacter sp.]
MKILLAEDDPKVTSYVTRGFTECGWSVDAVSDGRDALHYMLDNKCDVAILDRMMPGMDGLSVLKALRAAGKDTPVIFLTALGDVKERVEGLTHGADDYLTKPFHFTELHARVEALSRRGSSTETKSFRQVHDLTLDLMSRTANRGGVAIPLKTKEFALLDVLMRNEGRVVTKTMLLEMVWDFTFDPNSTVVETHISRLRAKIDKPFAHPLLHTVRNSGYTLHGPR